MAYQTMVLHGVVCKDRYHSIYRYCYGKIIRKQTIAQHNVKPRTTKVTILSWFGVKSRLKTFAVSIDTAIRHWANVYLFILANDNLQTCSHVDWQLYFYDILFGQIRQWKNLIETVSIDTTVLKAFAFLLVAGLSPKLTNEPTNDQDRIYTVLLRTACYALTEWFYAAWPWLKNGTV